MDESVLKTEMDAKAQELTNEQRIALELCTKWYNDRVWGDRKQVGRNRSELIKHGRGYVVQCELSKHTFSPGEWINTFYDRFLHVLGDRNATARIAARSATMDTPQLVATKKEA